MLHTSASVVCAKNGSITAVLGSGISVISDSLIAFQPAMDEPSNIKPCVKTSSSIKERSKVTCCHLPRGSVKRRSTNLTSLSLIVFRTDFASAAIGSVLPSKNGGWFGSLFLDGVRASFPCPDADRFFDIQHKNLSVADA